MGGVTKCLGFCLAGGVDSCRAMVGTRCIGAGVEGVEGAEGEGEDGVECVECGGRIGVDGVSGRGSWEAIWTSRSRSSSAGNCSGDVVEAAAVFPRLSTLTVAGVGTAASLLERNSSSTSDGRAFNLGRRPSIDLVAVKQACCSPSPIDVSGLGGRVEQTRLPRWMLDLVGEKAKCEMMLCSAINRGVGLCYCPGIRVILGWPLAL